MSVAMENSSVVMVNKSAYVCRHGEHVWTLSCGEHVLSIGYGEHGWSCMVNVVLSHDKFIWCHSELI